MCPYTRGVLKCTLVLAVLCWVAGAQALEPSSAASQDVHNMRLELGIKPGLELHCNNGTLMVPNLSPSEVHSFMSFPCL